MTSSRAILGGALLLLMAGGAFWWLRDSGSANTAEKKAPPPVPVSMAKAVAQDMPQVLELTGRAEAYESVSVKSRVDGQVQSVIFTEGQHVVKGEPLLTLDPADFAARVRQAEATLARDQAQLVKAQTDVERALSLKGKGFVSDASVDTARAAAASADATVKADQAALDLARLQLDYATVRAPFDGVVGARLVFPGTGIKANDTAVAVVNRVKPMYVTFAVPEKYLPRLRTLAKSKNDNVLIPGKKSPLAGTLRFIDNAVDPTTGTVQVKAQFANDSEALVPGQFIDVSLIIAVIDNAVTIPAEAVQQGQDGAFVYVVKDDQSVEMRKIAVETTQRGIAIVQQGLVAGETVVTDGQLRLVPGAKVRTADTKPKP